MKFCSILFASLLAASVVVRADDVKRIKLHESGAAAAQASQTNKGHASELMIYPAAKKPSSGTIMVCPGGGYQHLAVGHEGTSVAAMLNEAGWDAAVLIYRINEGSETRAHALEDAMTGLKLIQQHGGDYGLSTNKIGVMGFSAGGHLSARTTHETILAGNPPDFTVLMYPAYLEKDGVCLAEVAPTKLPTFLYVAANDSWAKSAIAYDKAAKEKDLPVEFHLAPSGGHGFGLKPSLPDEVKNWPNDLRSFLSGLSKK